MTAAHISDATPADHDAIAALLADAFCADPLMALLLPVGADVNERRTRLRDYYRRLFDAGHADTHVVEVARRGPDDEVLGVCLWQPPDLRPGVRATAQSLVTSLRAAGMRGIVPATRTSMALGRARPREQHWMLVEIGVAPDTVGTGLGGALLRSGLARVDAAAMPAYLEATTPGSARLYERHGFAPRAHLGLTPDGFPVTMWRPAQHRQ